VMCSVDWNALANWALVLIAFAALCVGKHQINETRKISRESTATNLYNRCMELSLQYPKLAEPALSGGFKKLVSDPEQGASYAWYVASLPLSCEEILAVTKNDNEWRASVIAALDGHTEYFRYRNEGQRPLSQYYSKELSVVIDELTANSEKPPEAMAIMMARLNHA
jgi:hypothetical protein